MAKIEVKGTIIDSEDQWIYDWFGIDAVSPKKINEAIATAKGEDLDVDINSGGGSVFAGSEIYSALRAYEGNVNIHVVGLAASAASIIACAGHSDISPTGQVMVHNVSTCAGGDYHDMEKASEMLQQANKAIASAYVAKTGMSMDDALGLMDNETWLTASDAVEKGLIDEIAGQKNSNTSVDFAKSLVASISNTLPSEVIAKYQAKRNDIFNRFNELKTKEHSDD